ncbi:DUF883 family protein [Phytohalomonas tamaricis]|uniref:DUF883 family protein n=1 Tax=Phytohalomonas tamaricis TaxID=2081032 RepID=UPI000D0B124B|nr:DUF883 family protein [Phytohalomonas tamaricis]
MFGLFSSKRDRYAKEFRKELRHQDKYGRRRLSELTEGTRERLGKAGDYLDHEGHRAWEYTEDSLRDLDYHVHRKPWAYIGAGTALGLITGILIGRRY